MVWLDSLLAVPVVGVAIVPNMAEILEFQKREVNFIDFLSKQKEFGIEQLQISQDELWGYSMSAHKTGFTFKVSTTDISGQFMYHINKVEKPGGLPSYELPEILPYNQILDRLLKYLENIFNAIKDLQGFKFKRIGIVASVSSIRESLPPGVLLWLDYMAKPWGGLVKSETLLLAKLFEDDNYYDWCHHTLRFDETVPGGDIKLMLDWQRVFKEPIGLSESGGLMANVETCKSEALNYLQRFGEGELNYA